MVYVKRGEGVEDIRRREGDTDHNIGVKTDTHEGRGGPASWGPGGQMGLITGRGEGTQRQSISRHGQGYLHLH